jgi:hypothetical protein
MSRSKATLFPEPVFVARERCEACGGGGKVPTPDMAAWEAKVERIRLDTVDGFPSYAAAYEGARKAAGPPPEQTAATCKGCEGNGYKDTELGIEELRDLLATTEC